MDTKQLKALELTLLIVGLLFLPATGWAIVLPEEPEEIQASEYTSIQKGEKTASGELYDPAKLSCSHHSLPFGTVLRIQNQLTGRSIDVKVNDRSSKQSGTIALSTVAAKQLGMQSGSKIPVMATPIGLTTAKLEPAKAEANQTNSTAIASYDPSAFGGEEKAAPMTELLQNTIPVSFDINGQNKSSSFPSLFGSTTTPTTANQNLPQSTHGSNHQRVNFVSSGSSENETTETPATASAIHQIQATSFDATTQQQQPIQSLPQRQLINEPQPLRAQFGAFSHPVNADAMMSELNQVGFQTTVIRNGSLYYVVTKGTFTSQESASHWIKEVKRLHGRDVAKVRL